MTPPIHSRCSGVTVHDLKSGECGKKRAPPGAAAKRGKWMAVVHVEPIVAARPFRMDVHLLSYRTGHFEK
jgi:hypothetical protein